jgi:hypothetical protein
VDIEEIAIFESLGICFGRIPKKYDYDLVEVKGRITRHV